MVCRPAHTRMPSACGKPGHFSWPHAEHRSPSSVPRRNYRSSIHISTSDPSTACGRRGGLRTVDKWHVSVDKPHPLGRRRFGERFSREFSGARRPRQPSPLEVCSRRGVCCLLHAIHGSPLAAYSFARRRSINGRRFAPVNVRGRRKSLRPPHLPSPYDDYFY